MTSKYDYAAVYDVNKYLWSRITSAGVLATSSYTLPDLGITIVPIVPVQEVPELSNHLDSNPYIVYDVMTTKNSVSSEDAWWHERDEVTYAIYAPSTAKLNEIVNCIKDSFRQMDQSAARIQLTAGISNKFWFHTTDIEWTENSKGGKDESGRLVAEVQVCYNYSRKSDSTGQYE
jgi:hypothetical protein